MPRLLAAAFLLLCAAPAWADPLVYTGRIERIEFRPYGARGCPDPCPVSAPRADGVVTVCVTNSGGCQATEFRVGKVFAGHLGPTRTIKDTIGEWGQTFRLTKELLLVVEDGGRTQWTYAIERDGQVLVRPGRLYSIPPAQVHAIGPNETGLVPAAQLIAELGLAR